MNDSPTSLARRLSVFAFLALAVFLIYSNTFRASWHLDDRPNIVNNYYLHLDSLHPKKLVNTFYTDHHDPERLGDRLYRPVACLSFALNWYVGRDNVVGYHIVNTVIHLLTGYFLFLFILQLFNAPNLRTQNQGNPFFIAFLASLLWSIHPIQTQAVTYIVQRMAQLAAFFYILGLFAYLKARLEDTIGKKLIWIGCCLLFYFLGVNSKPNAAMLPMAIILMEIAFFQDLSERKTRKNLFTAVSIAVVLIVCLGSLLFLKGNPLSFLDLYNSRTFTLSERLLTQPRILLFYLSQLAYPSPDRLSIAHDVVLSSSLTEPWTTLPSILVILSLLGFSILKISKKPVLCFSVLFFFLNHLIESSVIGLELIFEHRNYLPSFFLFLPVSLGTVPLLALYRKEKKVAHALIMGCIMGLVCVYSTNTYIRNMAWKDDITLWMDAVSKAPDNARASNILGIKLAWGDHSRHPKRYDMALKLFQESLDKNLPRNDVKAGIHGNMALIYFHKKNDPQKAFRHFNQALKIDPGNLKIRRELVEALIIKRNFETARGHANILLSKKSENGRYLQLKGHVLLWQGNYPEALACFSKAYPLLANKNSVVLNSGVALSLAGRYEKSNAILMEAIGRFPAQMPFYFAIIENSIRAGDEAQAAVHAQQMLKIFTIREVNIGIQSLTNNPEYAPLNAEPIRLVLDRL